jgi:hypothetical protein
LAAAACSRRRRGLTPSADQHQGSPGLVADLWPGSTRRTACRACGNAELATVLELGEMPLPDALLREDQLGDVEPRYPLDVVFCSNCSLVQILDEVPPERLFVDNYLYFSSYSTGLLRHARKHALDLIRARALDRESLVIEVASNDGYLLKNFVEHEIPVLGIDPAPDQAAAAEKAGVPTLREFFGPEVARNLLAEGKQADVIVANNVMAHTPDLNGFAEGLSILLADDGVATIENTYVKDLVDRCEFDTIYHEHFCYFSCTAVDALMRRHGLSLERIDYFPDLQGGSVRWHVSRNGQPDDSVRNFLRAEAQEQVDTLAFYDTFGARVAGIKSALLQLLNSLKAERKTIAAYGAAAKGSTLANYVGIGPDLVDFVVDRNTYKQGLFTPGTHLPIREPGRLLEDMPDFLLLFAWNYADEIVEQQAEYRDRGGRFIIPVPWPLII